MVDIIDNLWFRIFVFICILILAICVGADIRYYWNHFKGDRHGGKDNSRRRKQY